MESLPVYQAADIVVDVDIVLNGFENSFAVADGIAVAVAVVAGIVENSRKKELEEEGN